MAEAAQITNEKFNDLVGEFDAPFELTNEQWLDALTAEREPERRYIGESIRTADVNANSQYDARVGELERHANSLATRESAEHSRNVENARTIGQVAGLICSYRDVELAA